MGKGARAVICRELDKPVVVERMSGRLKLDELITLRYAIEESPQAFADLESGKNARGVISFQKMDASI